MKKLILIFAAVFTTTWVSAQSCPVPEPLEESVAIGTWKGAYSSEGKFLDMTLKISKSNGKLVASLDIPEVNAKNVAYTVNICDSEELHIKNQDISSVIEFIGRPENGTINGRVQFMANGQLVSQEVFTARRTSSAVAIN